MDNSFTYLNSINVNDYVEKKNGLSYLSWSWAWQELKKKYPNASYEVERFGDDNKPYLYDENLGYMVFTSITINDLTHEMWLPVMDNANMAMKKTPYKYNTRSGEKTCNSASMTDINKTIMRCLTKNIAMFGLGLYIYGGEDLPEPLPISSEQIEKFKHYYDEENMRILFEAYKIEKLEELSYDLAQRILDKKEKSMMESENDNK